MILAITVLEKFIQTLAKGLAQGALYALVALGFVLIFKATQTVNFAQGAIALIGAWFASLLLVDWRIPGRWLGDNDYVVWTSAVVLAALMTAVLGLIIERLAIRPMIGEPLFSIAVITLGIEAVLRTIGFDAVNLNPRSLTFPWGFDGFNVGDAFVAWTYVAIYLTAGLAFIAVFYFFRTRLGIAMRAVAFDQEAALAQGISVGKVFAVAWGSSAALAAIAGVLSSGAPIGNGVVSAGITGLAFRALPAVILGGLDSVQGALVGGLAIGCAEVFSGEYLSKWTDVLGNGYSLIVPYVVMLAVLLVRPYGLYGTPEIRRV
jgi:branched-chain amino acid transport system permease protein